MKNFTVAAMDAIKRGDAVTDAALEILCTPPIRIWSGKGRVSIDGNLYDGIGDRGLVKLVGGSIGSGAQSVTLSLSGIEPKAMAVLDTAQIKQAPATLYRLVFSSDATNLLDAEVFKRGRIDHIETDDIIGGAAKITVNLETSARGLGRRGGRMRTDADQRLIDPLDGFFKNVAFAGEKQLYWGGTKPATAATVLNGGAAAGTPGKLSDLPSLNFF